MRSRAAVLVAVWAAMSAACASADTPGGAGTELRVFAAASLTEAFTEIGNAFERRHEGVVVEMTFAGSPALVRQIVDGASVDVFASADEETMLALVDAGHARGSPVVFARNRIAVIVQPGNPTGIRSLADLTSVATAVCAPQVPCGRLAAEMLDRSQIELRPTSLEQNVKAVVAKVALGEVDAGLVFATDALASEEQVDTVEIDAPGAPESRYEMVVARDADEADLAAAWVTFVRGDQGGAVLRRFGFVDSSEP